MGHNINAIIGGRETLARLIEQFGSPKPTEIPFDLIIVPLDEQRLDVLATSTEPSFDGFTYLTPTMVAEIGRKLGAGPALYIETEYHGGTGGQGAALFNDGMLVWRRTESTPSVDVSRPWLARLFRLRARPAKSPISEGLANLGVVVSGDEDEFDRVELRKFRSLEALGLVGH